MVVYVSDEGQVVLPARVSLSLHVLKRPQESRYDGFYTYRVGFSFVLGLGKCCKASLIQLAGSSLKYGGKKSILFSKVIASKSYINTCLRGYLAECHPLKSSLSKQMLGGIENPVSFSG